MNTVDDDYPCLGVCMIDADGYCIGCGRPPPPELVLTQVDEATATDCQTAGEPARVNSANRAD